MSNPTNTVGGDLHLSHSSANLLRNCETKYFHHKVNNTEPDNDVATDNSHFDLGKAFHYINEVSMHKKPVNISELLDYCIQEIGMKESERGLVHAMIIQYLRLRAKSEFEVVAVEYKIQNEWILGFIDLIEVLPNGNWTISDLKTASSFYESKIPELPKDRQLNLYASFYKEIAEKFNLDADKFIGVRYLVTTKSKAMPKKTIKISESYSDYVMRLVEGKNVKSYAIFIPKELLDIEGVVKEHRELYEKSLELRNGKPANKNFTYCQAYFRPCEFFSKCHGMTFSEFQNTNKIIVDAIK